MAGFKILEWNSKQQQHNNKKLKQTSQKKEDLDFCEIYS